MDREQLFQNLSELEKQLRGIKSATDHVNQVIAADRELVAAVNAFTAETKRVLDATRSVYDGEVSNIKKAAIDALDKSAVDFSAKVTGITAELTTNVNMLRQTVDDSIKPMVNETVGVIEHTLKPFVTEEMPNTFNGFIERYKNLFDKAAGDISAASEIFAEQAGGRVEELKQTVLAIQGPQEQIKTLLENIKYATDASNELIRQDVEVSRKAGEDTITAAKKIDDVAKTISSSIAEVKESITANSQAITEYVKNTDARTRSAVLEKVDALQALPALLEALQSLIESSFLSLNTAVSNIATKVDSIARDTKNIKALDTKVKNIAEDVLANKSSLEQIQKENKTIKMLLVLSIVANVLIGLGVLVLLAARFKLF